MATLDVYQLHSRFTNISRPKGQAVQNLYQHHWKIANEGLSLQRLLRGEVQSYDMLDYNLSTRIKFTRREEHLHLYNLIEEKYKNPGIASSGIYLKGQSGIGTS